MQGTKDNLYVNVPTFDGIPMFPRGLTSPYQQQAQDINQMVQSEVTKQLQNQLILLEQRADSCIKLKDKALEEEKKKRGSMQINLAIAMAEIGYWKKLSDKKSIKLKDKALDEEKKKCGEIQFRLNKALSEVSYWKMLSDQKTKLCNDLVERLMLVNKRETKSRKRNVENKYSEEAHSSTGDNVYYNDAESSMNVWLKRPRH